MLSNTCSESSDISTLLLNSAGRHHIALPVLYLAWRHRWKTHFLNIYRSYGTGCGSGHREKVLRHRYVWPLPINFYHQGPQFEKISNSEGAGVPALPILGYISLNSFSKSNISVFGDTQIQSSSMYSKTNQNVGVTWPIPRRSIFDWFSCVCSCWNDWL